MRAFTALLVLAFAAVVSAQGVVSSTTSSAVTVTVTTTVTASSTTRPAPTGEFAAPAVPPPSSTSTNDSTSDLPIEPDEASGADAVGVVTDRFTIFLTGSAIVAGAVYQMV
jgi:hypothetical protein